MEHALTFPLLSIFYSRKRHTYYYTQDTEFHFNALINSFDEKN